MPPEGITKTINLLSHLLKVVGWLYFVGILGFLTSIYTLGADWWGKFQRVFV